MFRNATLALVLYVSVAPAFADALFDSFQNPPAAARPRVWWHWMNGNVTEEGIRLDLEWMKRVGIGGLQNFDAALDTPQIVDNRLVYMTPSWKRAFRFAAGLAEEFGLEMAIAASPGWSESGGPWVTPADGMKKLVWSETEVRGGQRVSVRLPPPPSVTGPFQDMPLTDGLATDGTHADIPRFYSDTVVLAYRVTAQEYAVPPTWSFSAGTPDASLLMDGKLSTAVEVPASVQLPWIQAQFAAPRTVNAFTLGAQPTVSIFAPPRWRPALEASADGKAFRRIAEIPAGTLPQYTVSFAPVTARFFRVSFPSAAAPPTPFAGAPGAVFTPLQLMGPSGNPARIRVSEVRLHSTALVHRFEEKAAFATTPDYYAIETPAEVQVPPVSLAQVVDVSPHMRADGTLDWSAPAGRWKVLRFGYSLIGKVNHPATAEATGLEVDKLDRAAVERYIDTYLNTYADAAGPGLMGSRGVRGLLNDSIEVGAQNWTPRILNEFRARRGYDAVPWLPALTGVILESAEKTDAFLYDYRRTLGDLIAENHYAQMARSAHVRGLIHYSEALEANRPTLGDDMEMRRHADVPMAAMWSFARGGAPRPMSYADMRGAASVAHIYGQNIAAAESLTSAYAPWAASPRDLQPMIDYEFVSGINRPVIHTSVHQPVTARKPGLSLAVFGQYFNRNETWAEQAGPWVSYLSRSSHLLQQGRYVADVAYFYGEESALTGLYSGGLPKDVPTAHAFDFVNADVVLNRLSVVDGGDLATSSGMRYRVLYLGGSSHRMTVPLLRRLRDLVQTGATLVGERPERSPSLADDAGDFREIADELWPAGASPTMVLGKGRVLRSQDIDAALSDIGVMADFSYAKPESDSELMFIHRQLADGHVYFVTNRRDRPQRVSARFRVSGKQPELWRAQSGRREPLSYRMNGPVTEVPLELAALEGVFVVFREAANAPSREITRPQATAVATLDDDWQVSFEAGRGVAVNATLNTLGAWNESADASIRYFSGTGTYVRELDVPKKWLQEYGAVWLDLGVVRELAEVVINGKPIEVLWREPYRTDIRGALKPGRNVIEVRVTNLWVNRLIGDAQPGANRLTFTTLPAYTPEAPLRLSGMVGPVTLLAQPRTNELQSRVAER